MNGHYKDIFKERDRKLEEAWELRKQKRQQTATGFNSPGEADIPLTQAG
jgi:hypothetical protein